jgi:hypothetical protein
VQRQKALESPVMPYCERVWNQEREYDHERLRGEEKRQEADELPTGLDPDLELFLDRLDSSPE